MYKLCVNNALLMTPVWVSSRRLKQKMEIKQRRLDQLFSSLLLLLKHPTRTLKHP